MQWIDVSEFNGKGEQEPVPKFFQASYLYLYGVHLHWMHVNAAACIDVLLSV